MLAAANLHHTALLKISAEEAHVFPQISIFCIIESSFNMYLVNKFRWEGLKIIYFIYRPLELSQGYIMPYKNKQK